MSNKLRQINRTSDGFSQRMQIPPHLINYQANITRLKSTPYLHYPNHVHIETMAVCNATCTFCPYRVMERKGTRMSDALLQKIITELGEIPQGLPLQISPFKVNEPFLDERLFDILHEINSRVPNGAITLTSNASVIDETILTRLAVVQRLSYLWISLNEYREAEYKQIMGLPFARTLESLQLIHRAKSEGRLPCRVVLSRVGDGSSDDREFCNWVTANFPLFEISIFPRGGWLGQAGMKQEAVLPVGCARWFELSITASGKVAHCCMDGTCAWPIGDVNTQHLLEVYNAPHYRHLREHCMTRQQAEPCSQCGFL